MLLKAEFNGRSCDVWFDTGNAASAVTMSRATADRLMIDIPPEAVQRVHTGVSGSGVALVFPIGHIRVGPIDKSNIDIAVNEGSAPSVPLLGQDFFKDYQFTIDYENKTIKFLHR
jgi:predicted aspartyl protease